MARKTLLIAGVLLTLAGCSGERTSSNEVLSKVEARGLDNGTVAPAPAAIERSQLVGRWSDAPGCQDVISEFREDGTVQIGNQTGTWALDGNRLTISRNGQASALIVESVTATEFFMRADTGERLRSYRCAAAR